MKDKKWGGYYKSSLWHKLINLAILQGSGGGEQWATVTGAIASFITQRSAPLRSLVCDINPVQDLHGYDAPWPAGGGANILDPSKRTIYSDGKGQRWYYDDGYTLKANQAYTFSVSGTSQLITLYIIGKETGTTLISGSTGGKITYTPEADTVVYFQAYRGEVIQDANNFQLEFGSSATSFSPYENICPISGHTGVDVCQTKENLFSFSAGRTGYTWSDGFGFADISVGDTGITFNGTSTSEYKFHVVGASITLEAGTYKAITTSEDVGIYLYGGGVILTSYGLNGEVFTLSSATTFESEHLAFVAKSGASFSNTFVGIQISQVKPTHIEFPALGANQWDEDWEVGGIAGGTGQPFDVNDRIRSKNFCSCDPSTNYYLFNNATGVYLYIWWYDENQSFISTGGGYAAASGEVVTSPATAKYFKISTYSGNYTEYKNNFAVNYPSTVTTYEPYNDTVYGGTLDVVSGVLTAMWVSELVKDINSWTLHSNTSKRQAWSYTGVPIKPVTLLSDNVNAISSEFKAVSNTDTWAPFVISTPNNDGTGLVVTVNPSQFANAEEFKTAFGDAQIVYELATPITYQLTPQEVDTLVGQNNVWNTAGDTTVEYRSN